MAVSPQVGVGLLVLFYHLCREFFWIVIWSYVLTVHGVTNAMSSFEQLLC